MTNSENAIPGAADLRGFRKFYLSNFTHDPNNPSDYWTPVTIGFTLLEHKVSINLVAIFFLVEERFLVKERFRRAF